MLHTVLKGVIFFLTFATLTSVYVQTPEVYTQIFSWLKGKSEEQQAVRTLPAPLSSFITTELDGADTYSSVQNLYDLLNQEKYYHCRIYQSPAGSASGDAYVGKKTLRAEFRRVLPESGTSITTYVLYASSTTYVWNAGNDGYRIAGEFLETQVRTGTASLYYACEEDDNAPINLTLPRGVLFTDPTQK